MYKKIILSLLASSILVAQSIELGQITVTSATKTTQSIEDVTSNVNVITSKEIEEKHYTTVTEAINSISGISFTSNGGLGKSTDIYIRGLESKRVLVLMDGIRYNDITGTSGAPFSDLMIVDIEQIEVIKGAQSGIWGADATAGVINIITKSAKKGAHASVFGEYGSFNTKKYGVLASYKADSYYLKLNSQKIATDGFTAKAPKYDDIDMYEDDGYTNTTSNIKFGVNIDENNKIDFSHTIVDSNSEYDKTGFTDVAFSETKNNFSQINFNGKNSFTELDVYAKLSKFERNYPYETTKEFYGEVKEYGVKTNTPYRDEDFVIFGLDYKNFEHKNDLNEKYANKALFLTNNNKIERTIITESFRVDDYDKFDNKATGKLGIKHSFSLVDGLSANVNIGSAYNVPTLSNLYNPSWGNPNIKPESTKSYDIGVGYKDLKLTYFNSTTKDMIEYDFGTSTYNNIDGDIKIQGVEIEYNTNITKNTKLTSSFTYLDARNSDDEVLRRRPKNSFNLSLDYYGVKDLHVGINSEYIGTRYSSDNELGEQTGKYAVVNCVLNYSLSKNFSIYAKLDNMFDRYYQVLDGYATAPKSGYAGIKANF